MSISLPRLVEEHRQWKHNHPRDFSAKPLTTPARSLDYHIWECGVPGPAESPWEGGQYYVTLTFSEKYPEVPPRVRFDPPILHPNVFPSGVVSLSILEEGWYPHITIRDVLLGLQRLMVEPNLANPANSEAYRIYMEGREGYDDVIRNQAAEFSLEYEEEEEEGEEEEYLYGRY